MVYLRSLIRKVQKSMSLNLCKKVSLLYNGCLLVINCGNIYMLVRQEVLFTYKSHEMVNSPFRAIPKRYLQIATELQVKIWHCC